MEACGREVWMVGTENQGDLTGACLAELIVGRIRRRLRIQSTQESTGPAFWSGLTEFCRRKRITTLSLGTIGTRPDIPAIGRFSGWNDRYEYWVDLQVPDIAMELRPQQRRVLRRAKKRGLEIRVPDLESGLETHRQLTSHSLARRRARGEDIPFFESSDIPGALVRSGSGLLFECVRDEEVLGSVVFTQSRLGAHGYSAGFSKQGMSEGAAVFLDVWTFEKMKAEGKTLFNLGDAPPDSGLATFKRGLGGKVHESRAAEFDMAAGIGRLLVRGAAAVDTIRRRLGR